MMLRSAGRVLSVAALLAFLLASPARADKYAGEFLRLGAGARPLGMGGAFAALADDATAVYWNPAGLAGASGREIVLMHAEQFGSLVNYDFGAFAVPLGGQGRRASAVGLGFVRLGVDDIPITRDAYLDVGLDGDPGTGDEGEGNGEYDLGEPIDPSEFRYGSDIEMAFLVSYARMLSEEWWFGGTLKILRQDLLTNSSFGMGADLGVIRFFGPDLSFGARLADITTTRISWDTGRRESISPTVRLAAAHTRRLPALHGVATAALDVGLSFDGEETASEFSSGVLGGEVAAGVEYWYERTVALRVGVDAGNFTAGAGARVSRFGVDYAFVGHDEFDDSHRISGSVTF